MSPQRKVFRRPVTTAEKRRQSFHKGSLSCRDLYVVMAALRRIGFGGTELARATCGTIRAEIAEDRRAYYHQRASREDRLRLIVSVSGDLCARPPPAPMSRDLPPRSATQKQGTAPDLIKPLPAATQLCALRNRQPA